MTLTPDTISSTVGLLSIAAIALGVYNSVKKPQEKSDVIDAVYAEKFSSLEKVVINLRDNHLHTLDVKMDKHIEDHAKNDLYVNEQLTTVKIMLDERLPSKKNV